MVIEVFKSTLSERQIIPVREFLLVLADPYIETWSGGARGIKLLFNAGIAAFIFPLHAFFENKIKLRLAK